MAPAPHRPSASPRSCARPGPLPLAAALTAAAAGVLLVLVAASWSPLLSLDQDLARTAHRWALDHGAATHAQRVLSDWVWDPWTMRLLAVVAVAGLWVRGHRRAAVLCAVACLVGTVVQQALKAVVDRDRPVWAEPVDSARYQAFPSGHSLTAVVVLGLCLWALWLLSVRGAVWWSAVALAAVSVLGVGWTRVWLGVHWPSDVLGGWLLGAALVLATVLVHRRFGTTGSVRTGVAPPGAD